MPVATMPTTTGGAQGQCAFNFCLLRPLTWLEASPDTLPNPLPSTSSPLSVEEALDVAPSRPQGVSLSCAAYTAGDSLTSVVAQPPQQAASGLHTEPLQAPVDTPSPPPTCATPSPELPHRSDTLESCSSQASTDASSTVPTPRRKRSIPAHRTRHWAHFVRQPRGRWSLQSQKSDVIELLGTSSIELVDEPEDCEWEDLPDHPLEVTVA